MFLLRTSPPPAHRSRQAARARPKMDRPRVGDGPRLLSLSMTQERRGKGDRDGGVIYFSSSKGIRFSCALLACWARLWTRFSSA
jgi:hypothetical protein